MRMKGKSTNPYSLSMLTTAVGFGSLCLLIPAFREFGIYVSVGLFLDFVLTLTVGGELLKQASRKSKNKPRDLGIHFIGKKATWVIIVIIVAALISSPF